MYVIPNPKMVSLNKWRLSDFESTCPSGCCNNPTLNNERCYECQTGYTARPEKEEIQQHVLEEELVLI